MDHTTDTVPVTFTAAELWLLHACIKHEMAAQDAWHYPYASLELNDQIAQAVLLTDTASIKEATLLLSFGDCLAIDYTVPTDSKDTDGTPIGRRILIKSFTARSLLKNPYPLPDATQPTDPQKADVLKRLAERSSDA